MALAPGKKTKFNVGKFKPVSVKGIQNRVEDLQWDLEYFEERKRELQKLAKNKRNQEVLVRIDDLIKNVKEKLKLAQEKLAATNTANQQAGSQKYAKLVQALERDCSDAIKAYRRAGGILYRGVKNNLPNAYVGRPRTDRVPKDSTKAGQILFDLCLQKLGFTALRSNSIFATDDPGHANDYGKVYVVFPKNGFAFTYTNRRDLVIRYDEIESMLNFDKIEKLDNMVERFANKTGIDPISFYDYNNIIQYFTDLKKIGFPNIEKANVMNFISLANFKDEFEPVKTNFTKAITSGGEVLISGEYYAIKLEIAKIILPLLKIKLIDRD